MPADFKLIEARQPPLKDQYDEWLARIICYAFSVPVSPFVSQVNRATGETLRQQATQEGLVPLKAWVKNALDHVIQRVHERARPRIRLGRRRRGRSAGAGADAADPGRRRHQDARGGAGGSGACADGRRSRAKRQTLLHLQMQQPVRAKTPAFPRPRTKREHFLDRLRRSWHSHLQWEKWRRRPGPCPSLPSSENSFAARPSTGRAFACFLRSLHVRSRLVPATRQGRSRSAPRDRRCDGGDARSLRRDFRLRLEQALFREMVG